MLQRGEEGANSLRGAGGKVFRLGRGGGGGGGGRGTWTGDEGWSGKSAGRLGQGVEVQTGGQTGSKGWDVEATGRLGAPGSCAHILVASSSENLPLLIKSGGLMEEGGILVM